jgi:cytochrome oxidase Cu insertion factor (SCO1/SenC/PrrC family)
VAALGAVAALLALPRGSRPREPVPVLGALPDFSLVERGGSSLTRDSLRGRVWVADFIFTRCGGTCPSMTGRLRRLRREVPAEVRFLSLTVDPAHDTPAVLARHAQGVGAGPDWLWATGEKEAVYRLATDGFMLAAQENPAEAPAGDGPFLHSAKFVLLDGQARIRGYYDSGDEQALRALSRDAERLLRE